MLHYILFECYSTQFFDVALLSFAMLRYLYSDIALHSSHFFCDVALKVFSAFGTGERRGTGCIRERGQGRGGRNSIPFYSDPILRGQTGLGRGAVSKRISWAGRLGATINKPKVHGKLKRNPV